MGESVLGFSVLFCFHFCAFSSFWRLPTFFSSWPYSVLKESSIVSSDISLTLTPDSSSPFIQRTLVITLDPLGQSSILSNIQGQLTINLNFISSLLPPCHANNLLVVLGLWTFGVGGRVLFCLPYYVIGLF